MLQMETNGPPGGVSTGDSRRLFTTSPPQSVSDFEIVHPQHTSSQSGFYPTVVSNSTDSFLDPHQHSLQSPQTPTISANNNLQFTNSFGEYSMAGGRIADSSAPRATNNIDDSKQQSNDQPANAFNLSDQNMEKIRTVFAAVPANTGAWNEFLDYKQFHFPTSCEKVFPRMLANFRTYYGNYLILGLVLSLYCIVTSPLLLVGSVVFGCLYYGVGKQSNPVNIFGQPINRSHLLIGLSVCALVCFFLLGITSVFFWLIGATTCISVLHAVFHEAATDADTSDSGPDGHSDNSSSHTGHSNNGHISPNATHPMTNSQFEVVTF